MSAVTPPRRTTSSTRPPHGASPGGARTAMPLSLNTLSLNSPSRQASLSLKDVIHKSAAAPKKTISSAAAVAAATATTTTRRRPTPASPTKKRAQSPSRTAKVHRGPADDGLSLAHSATENSRSLVGRRSPVKGPSKLGGLAAGGGLGRMDVVSKDWDSRSVQPERKSPVKKGKHDRYIPTNDHTGPIIIPASEDTTNTINTTATLDPDPNHTSEISASLGIDQNKRILSFFVEPPPAPAEQAGLLATYSRRTVPRPGTGPASSQSAASHRRIATTPERVLDAPGLVDDYYLNLLDWGSTNLVAIALSESVYVWNAETGEVTPLCSVGAVADGQSEGDDYVCSVRFAEDGSYLAVGLSSGPIQVYDVTTGTRMRTMAGHLSRVPSLSWSGAILSSGCRTGEIWNSDVRVAQHRVAEMRGHRGEVCGLEWRPEVAGGLSGGGMGLLASGANDNVVNVWDGRMNNAPKMTKTNHTAAVKALAWCPWESKLLATGGGSTDRFIHFWNTQNGARLNSLETPSQVTSLVFNPHSREILSSHGVPDHHLSIYSYPSLAKVTDISRAHETRILHSCLSPDGTVVATASSDENLKFWRVFEGRKDRVGSKAMGERDVDGASGLQRKGKTGIRVR